MPRGIRLPVFQTAGDLNSRTIVTLWTSRGDVSFTPRDLESGPILIPSLGIFISTAESRITPTQFQSQLTAMRLRTIRQQVRAGPKESWASAMKRFQGDRALPDFPKPPYEPPMQIDVPEDHLVRDGQNGQNGYNDAPALHLRLDDVPLFLRGMYNSYAAEVDPDLGYIFWEVQKRQYARDKTFEEAGFLERVRAMLVMEDGNDLWLARATPRAWLEQGRKIAVKNAPTYVGTIGYEILSDVDHGKISATVEMPARNAPKAVRLPFRHPKTAPIKSVTVDGKPWPAFDKDQEAIELKGVTGRIAVVANYW